MREQSVGPAPVVSVVVPFLNARRYLEQTAPTLVAAARAYGNVELIYVDNGSTDAGAEYLATVAPELIRVVRRPGVTIAALRNEGARIAAGEYLAFLDADCAIEAGYFDAAVDVLRRTGASATGCEVDLPRDPHWIEQTLHLLHFTGREREVDSINSGNFFIARHAFESVGGFREELDSGEGSDIGQRLTAAGFKMRECPNVHAVHLGNPKSVGAYYRYGVRHGFGMFATVQWPRLDRPIVMLLVHLALTIAGVAWLAVGRGSVLERAGVLVALQLFVPAVTVAFRIRQTRRTVNMARAIYLYWIYYWARLHALALLAAGRGKRFSG